MCRTAGALLLALLSLGARVVLADEPPAAPDAAAEPDEIRLFEEVVVTATRTEQKLKDLPANVSVITRTDLERSPAATAADLLREIPGFALLRQWSSAMARPVQQAVSLRGVGGTVSSRTLVLVDGVPLNAIYAGWVHWSRVPAESVERVEVVRGGSAGVWGNLALGGVIQVKTLVPEKRALRLMAEGGNLGTTAAHLWASDVRGPLRAALGASLFTTGGHPVIRADQRGTIDGNADSASRSGSLTLRYEPTPRAAFELRGSLFSEERSDGTPVSGNSTQIGALSVGADVATASGRRLRFLLFGSHDDGDSTVTSPARGRNSEILALNQFDVPATTLGASAQWTTPAARRHVFTIGVDLQRVEAETHEDSAFVAGAFTRRRVVGGRHALDGVYMQDVVAAGPRWRVIAGLRLDRWRSLEGFRLERDLRAGATLTDARFPERDAVTLNPSLGVVHHASERVSLRASAYRGFRAPTIHEMFRPFRTTGNVITEANPGVDPERLRGVEVGVDWSGVRFLGRFNAFWNEVEDPIFNLTVAAAGASGRVIPPCGFVPAFGACRQRGADGRLLARGLEAEVEFRPVPRVTLAASYLFNPTRVVDVAAQPALEGKRNARTPVHSGVLKAAYSDSRWSLGAQGRYVGRRYEDDLNLLPVADLFVLDLRLTRRIGGRLELLLAVENLFNSTYETIREVDGTVSVGGPRWIRGGFRLRL